MSANPRQKLTNGIEPLTHSRQKLTNPRQKLTNTIVSGLPAPKAGQTFFYDSEVKPLAVRVTPAGHKSFVVNAWQNGRVHRVKVGNTDHLSVNKARNEARKILGDLAAGANPNEEKRQERARSVTLGETFDAYLKARKNLATRTVYEYRRLLDTYLGDWKGRPVAEITKDMVERRHAKLGEGSGPAQANHVMRFARALFNFAIAKYEDAKGQPVIAHNPVKRLSQARAWYRVDRRRTYIKPHDMPAWYEAVMHAESETVRDYLLLLVLTGLRRNEGARLRWDQVDLKGRSFTVNDTKNKQPHSLPLSDFLLELLAERRKRATNDYVFPGPGGNGHLIEPKRTVAHVIETSGVHFTLHDLRRTFATAVDRLEKSLSYYGTKRLMNHKVQDVTGDYIQYDIESLREPMQQVTDYLLRWAGAKPSARVTELRPRAT